MWKEFNPLKFDYFIVVDLEATCSKDDTIPREEMEIIEIGAVMYDRKNMRVADEFDTLVRPTRNPILSKFCEELTSITQNKVCEAPNFPEAFLNFTDWYESFNPEEKNILFSSWGNYDKNQLLKDCAFHGIKYPFGVKHLDIKRYFTQVHNLKNKLGMKKALHRIGLELEGTHHRGIDDARNTSRLLENCIARDLLTKH